MSNTIELVGLPGHLKTAYGKGGRTRDAQGVPLLRELTLSVSQAGGAKVWRASKATATAIEMLDKRLVEAGAEGTSLTEVWRDQVRVQKPARDAYLAWVKAGRPQAGEPGWRSGMKTAYVAAPGESNHGWGGAIDENIFALRFRVGGKTYTGNEALSIYWDISRPLGFTPIIKRPNINQSEAWHFDHWGPLADVRALFNAHRGDDRRYSNTYGLTAGVGCILAGQLPGDRQREKYVQARLLIGGFWCGLPDGYIGRMTRQAITTATGSSVKGSTPVTELVALLDEHAIGLKEVWSA